MECQKKNINTYRRYQEDRRVRNTVAGSLGKPYKKEVGIPQGDPLSMLFAALILLAWAELMKEEEIQPYLFVDGVMLVATGDTEEEVERRFVMAMELSLIHI